MRKLKLSLIVVVAVAMVAGLSFMTACAQEAAAPETVVVTETVVETVVETVEVEVEKESPYTYEKLREMANAGAYEGEPAAGHTMAFANIIKSTHRKSTG